MERFKYLIVGGGMTADAAVRGIREIDSAGSIGVVTAEADPPYKRPPLTKGLWKGEPEAEIWLETEKLGLQLRRERRIQSIDPKDKSAVDDQGIRYEFEKVLLATGGTPRRLGFDDGGVIYYRSVQDYRRLRQLVRPGRPFAVLGGGFIGSEIAAGLAMNEAQVTMIFPSDAIGANIFPSGLARFVTDHYRAKGVRIFNGDSAVRVERRAEESVLGTKNGREVGAAAVVAGLGIEPNVGLARSAALTVEDGIVVDERLTTSAPDVFAAGDVASFFQPSLGKRMRVEHEDNALTMGRAAGRSMAGDREPYRHLPFFYSDLFELGYEAVGETDARLEIYEDWKEENREGVVYYLRDGRVRGVLLWNVWNQVDAARRLIAEPNPVSKEQLKGRLPA